jgi:hypothetical protein
MPMIIAVDAAIGSIWSGDNDDPDDSSSDAFRASEAVLESDSVLVRVSENFVPACAQVNVGEGKAIVMQVGSSGVLEVYRHGPRLLLVEGSYRGPTTERPTTSGTKIVVPSTADYMQYVGGPRHEDAGKVGMIEAKSEWLLLLPITAPGATARELTAAAKTDAVTVQPAAHRGQLLGVAVKVAPGRYNVIIEPEVELDFGLVARAMIERA